MTLEDYLDAVQFRELGFVPPREKWVDELRYQAGARSFQGIG
jgi:hypothetical protein